MNTEKLVARNDINLAAEKVSIFPFAATGAEFWDKERELKQCWESSSERDWSVYMQKAQFAYSWDFREVVHRTK